MISRPIESKCEFAALANALRARDPILAVQLALASRYPDKPVIRSVIGLRLAAMEA